MPVDSFKYLPGSIAAYYRNMAVQRRDPLPWTPLQTPLSRARFALVTTAGVNYISGLEQPGNWHSGAGGDLRYRSPSNAWQLVLGYAYGIDAIRSHGRGAHSVGVLLQFDLDRAHVALFEPGE